MELQTTWISSTAAKVLDRRPGFRIKAAFRRVINLESGAGLVAVQTDRAALTPLSVQVSQDSFRRLAQWPGSKPVHLQAAAVPPTDCRIPAANTLPDAGRIRRLGKLMAVLAKSDSLAFVPDPLWRALDRPSAVQRQARVILEEAQRCLSARDFAGAAKALDRLAGLGPGLTPAGDDFLIGVLAACNRYPFGGLAGLKRELEAVVRQTVHGRTWLSAALLQCAVDGQFSQPAGDILAAEDDAALTRAVAAGAAWGHTSGSDTLGGMLWTVQPAFDEP